MKITQRVIHGLKAIGGAIGEVRIIDYLLPKEPIGGIEITESSLRFVFLKKGKKEVTEFVEAPLRGGLITKGVPQDIDTLAYFLTINLDRITKGKKLARKFVASVPDSVIHTQPFFIPLGLSEEEEIAFVKNNFHLISPFPYEDTYVDWQEVETQGNRKIVFVAVGIRSVIDKYRNALSLAGVDLVALEPFALSAHRMIEIPKGLQVLFFLFRNKLTVSVLADAKPYFTHEHILGEGESVEERVVAEMRRLEAFVENEFEKRSVSFSYVAFQDADTEKLESLAKEKGVEMQSLAIKEVKAPDESFTLFPGFVAVTGAAMRGLIPRAKDTIVSVLPVGTELAYIRMKKKVFFTTLRYVSIGVAVLILTSFVGLYAFLATITQRELDRLELEREVVLPGHIGEIREAVDIFNREVDTLQRIQEMIISPFPSFEVIEEIHALPGIQLNSVSVAHEEEEEEGGTSITIRGVAAEREDFRALREHFERPEFSNVNFPIFSIVEATDISFTITFSYGRPDPESEE